MASQGDREESKCVRWGTSLGETVDTAADVARGQGHNEGAVSLRPRGLGQEGEDGTDAG